MPPTPTTLNHASSQTDTTPLFNASITDSTPGSLPNDPVKARFKLYQSDGVTFIGSVDSAFTYGSGLVAAEYSVALPVGTYKVKASCIDGLGAESADTAFLTFNITSYVNKDLSLLWNIAGSTTIDLSLLWDVNAVNEIDLELLWNVYQSVVCNLELIWDISDPWVNVEELDEPDWSLV